MNKTDNATFSAPAKPKKKRRGMAYDKKQGFVGFMFTLPWFIGFLMFFFVPAVKSIQFSFSDVKRRISNKMAYTNAEQVKFRVG